MKLDSEMQKKILIQIIHNTPLAGKYKELREDIKILDQLLESVKNAEIEINFDNKQQPND